MKSFRGTWIAGALVAILALFTINEYQRSNKQAEDLEKSKIVLRTPADQIEGLEILKGGERLVLEKTSDGWRIVEPLQDAADETAVTALIASITGETVHETVAEGSNVDYKTYGLDQPVETLIVKSKGGAVERINFGSVKAYDQNLYARVNEDAKVLLVGAAWDVHLAKLPKELRDKRLWRQQIANGEIKKIAITVSGEPKFELVREASNWRLAGRPDFPVQQDKVANYLEAVKAARLSDFTGKKLQELQRPALELKLFRESGDPVVVIRSHAPLDGSNVEQASPIAATSTDYAEAFELSRSTWESLAKDVQAFFDKRAAFQMSPAEVARIEVHSPDLKGAFVKKGDVWVASDPGLQKEVDSAKLTSALMKLSEMEAVRALGPGAMKTPEFWLKLSKDSGENVFEFRWGDAIARELREGRPELRYVPARTSKVAETFALSEGDIQALDLVNWFKLPEKKAATP